MSEFLSDQFINPAKTCAFTGHRKGLNDITEQQVEQVINGLIDQNFDTFLVGMALGFDTYCFKILERVRKVKPIKIVACIPCESQNIKFTPKQNQLYQQMLDSADLKILISKEYTPTCMQKRNMFMVDNSSVLVAYLRYEKGGTKNTVEYAKRQNKRIIYL